jgi:hypothetical protein
MIRRLCHDTMIDTPSELDGDVIVFYETLHLNSIPNLVVSAGYFQHFQRQITLAESEPQDKIDSVARIGRRI